MDPESATENSLERLRERRKSPPRTAEEMHRVLNNLPAWEILDGEDDVSNVYWNSFLPIFFDRMNLLMRKAMNNSMKDYGLTAAHSYYLIALDLQDGQTQSELSKFLDMDPANTTRVIKKLKQKGFVRDEKTSSNSKKYRIWLTSEGKKVADEVMNETQDRMNGYMEEISKEELGSMRSVLIRILNKVDPEFLDYVDSSYVDPFYTYLGAMPKKKEYTTIPIRDLKGSESKDKESDKNRIRKSDSGNQDVSSISAFSNSLSIIQSASNFSISSYS